jgi:hypothetical protein
LTKRTITPLHHAKPTRQQREAIDKGGFNVLLFGAGMKKTAFVLTLILSLLISGLVASVPSLKAADEAPKLEWSKTYGHYLADAVIQTVDGGYAIAGQNASFKPTEPHSPPNWENYTALMIKTDEGGNAIWEKSYEAYVGYGFFSNRANSVKQTKDSGYALCGADWFLKTDGQGNVQWNKKFSTLELFDVAQASDGGYVLIGNTKLVDSAGSVDSVLIKTDENGNTVWNKTFSSNLPYGIDVSAYSLEETDDGGYAIAGSWYGTLWFAKTDSNGNLDFNQTYGSISNFGALFSSISKTTDGGYALAGFDVDERKEAAWTGWVVKTDAQGNVQWSFHFEQPVSELLRGAEFRSITQTVDGGYVAVGYPALVKLDSSGRLLWNVMTYNAYSVSQTEDGGFIVAGGQGNPTRSDQRIWLAKFAPESGTPSPNNRTPPSSTNVTPPPFWATVLIAVVIVAVFAAGLGLLIYLIKRKR